MIKHLIATNFRVTAAISVPADGVMREHTLEADGLLAMLKHLNESYKSGGTEFRLSVLNPGHAILHAHGRDSLTFDLFWEV